MMSYHTKAPILFKGLLLLLCTSFVLIPRPSLAVTTPIYRPVDNSEPFPFIALNRKTGACIGAVESGTVTFADYNYWSIISSGQPQLATTPFGSCYAYLNNSPSSISSCCEQAGYKVVEDPQVQQDLRGDLGQETWFYKEKSTNREVTICADEKTKQTPFCEGKTAQNVTAEDKTRCEYHPTGLIVDSVAKTCGVAFEANEYLHDVYVPAENLSGSGSHFGVTVDTTQRLPQGMECPALQPIAGNIIHFGPAIKGYLDPSGKIFSPLSEAKTIGDHCRELGYHLVTLAEVKTKTVSPYVADQPLSEPWLTMFRYLGKILPFTIVLGFVTFLVSSILWLVNRKNDRGSSFRRWIVVSAIITALLTIFWFVVIFLSSTIA